MEFFNYLDYLAEGVEEDVKEYIVTLDSTKKRQFSTLFNTALRTSPIGTTKEEIFKLAKQKIDGIVKQEDTKTKDFTILEKNNIKVGEFDLISNFKAQSKGWSKSNENKEVEFSTISDFNLEAKKGNKIFTSEELNKISSNLLYNLMTSIKEELEKVVTSELKDLNKKLKSLGYKVKEVK